VPRARHRTCADVVPAQVDTLVVKRLAAGLQEDELLRLLQERGPAAAAAVAAELLRTPDGSFSGTAFVRYASPEAAQAALEALGARPRLGGRRAHVEAQKSKALLGGRELEALLSQEELNFVRRELERFLREPDSKEAALPSSLTPHQRKYAHSLAEQHGLSHSSRQGLSGETYVHLAKAGLGNGGSGVGGSDRRACRTRPKLHTAPGACCTPSVASTGATSRRSGNGSGSGSGGPAAGLTQQPRRNTAEPALEFPPGLGEPRMVETPYCSPIVPRLVEDPTESAVTALLLAAAAVQPPLPVVPPASPLLLSMGPGGLRPPPGLLPAHLPLDAEVAASTALGLPLPLDCSSDDAGFCGGGPSPSLCEGQGVGATWATASEA